MIYTGTFFHAGNQNVRGKTQLNDSRLLFSYFSLMFTLNAFLLYPTQKRNPKVYIFLFLGMLHAMYLFQRGQGRRQALVHIEEERNFNKIFARNPTKLKKSV